MYVEEIRRAVLGAPRERLADLAAALWKSHSAGAIGDDDAQTMAELIQARKAFAAPARPVRRHVGSRPRSSASIERRRSWSASGWLPPSLAAGFTPGEIAALSVVACEVAMQGRCELSVGAIAGRAGVCATVVKNAVREARRRGLLTVEQRRLTYARSLPNVVRIASTEWSAWIRFRGRGLKHDAARGEWGQICADHERTLISKRPKIEQNGRTARREVEGRTARLGLTGKR